MTPLSPLTGSAGDEPGRRGRKLGPIADGVGPLHRAWLEPLRSRLEASGMTASHLAERAGFSKSKVTELLRGVELYPQWEITYALVRVLGMPVSPMCRLWTAAAREAHKKTGWIEGSIARIVVSAGPSAPPLEHHAFTRTNGRRYTRYADVFLRDVREADRVVTETFDMLWLRWDEALASSHVQRYAWQVLRRGVMARARHGDGYPDLAPAAFGTVALGHATGLAAVAQVEQTLALFRAVSRLPDVQLDVIVLRYLRGMETTDVADMLGISPALVTSSERHARRSLTTRLDLPEHPEGPHVSDR
ncbi:helix-turn-helix domain-containing protein [Streptomyces sp. NPDC058655]|uniref:transcriptional regulator n=1 Tax=unclassified Streptomyces TaxID=2593676 RepID=UPI00365CF63C